MLKFLRKYKNVLLVCFGVLLMIAFLLPQAIQEIANQRGGNATVMRVGSKKISALHHYELTREYEVLNSISGGTIPLLGITEGPEQWILLTELAERGGYVGAMSESSGMLEDIGRTRALTRLRMQYGEQLFNSLISSPQLAPVLNGEIDKDIAAVREAYTRVGGQAKMTDAQVDAALAKLQGVQRMIRAYSAAARVSTPRAILRAERDLEGAQVDYIFLPAQRQADAIPTPDDATLQAFMEQYRSVKPGEGEYGVGYLLPERATIEYMELDAAKIGEKIVPDLREVRRRFNLMPEKPATFEEARPRLEAEIKREMVGKVMSNAQEFVRGRVGRQVSKLAEDGQFKKLPEDWAQKRPRFADMTAELVKYVEEKTRPDPTKPGITIDPPTIIVKDSTFLTAEELGTLEKIGMSSVQRGQRRISLAEYVLSVRELQPKASVNLQVGIPADEPASGPDGSLYFFTVLDTRPESTPRSIDEVRDRLVADWKRVEAYKQMVANDLPAFRQRTIAEGIDALADKTPTEPGKPPTGPRVRSGKVTRTSVSSQDPDVNTDTFRLAVVEAAEKLDPLMSADKYTEDQRVVAVALPQNLGVAVARIRTVAPLTIEDFRGRQNGLVQQLQLDEFRTLKSNPFTLDRLRQRLNVKYEGPDAERRAAAG